ncbi:Rap1-interacting factor 1 N terminal-domain-containing protein [Nemania sp. FL0916]|nr:Rap1-interacting factor 1 N terminal-domain-containing protein [Nemania sp. FL0916]
MVSPAAAPSAGLDALPARPPTPPRERQNDADQKLSLAQHGFASHLTLQTPPGHSPGSALSLSTTAGSRRSRKRVEFTVQAEYRDALALDHAARERDKENEHRQSTPVSAPPSHGLAKPLKSILKPTSSPNPPNPLDPLAGHGEPGSTPTLAAMLESAIKHLAGSDRDSKVDAYTMLVAALKTSTNLPDRIALQSKMSLFTQFIQRDITAKGQNGAIDSSLVNHALTLLSTFLHFPAIATTITPDFGVFIIDHCIRSFEDHAVPKDVVRHLMQVAAYQDFPPKVMTADRVGRLVTALHNIEDHIKGKSIIMSRILIYRRLVKQSTHHMVSHSEWLMDLFTDMLSSLKEIRCAAIALGLDASFSVAKEKQIPKKIKEILEMSVDETRYVEYYIDRLTAMTKERSEMSSVPQIWSVVILLLRCPLDRWEFFERWLGIIQCCFNSGDYQTKLEANYAWNRLVYALHLHESSFSKTIKTLCQPFNQLRRRGKQPDELRRVIIGGLCNLYYYAFKPNCSHKDIDHFWDTCVRTPIRTLAFPETDGRPTDKQQAASPDNLPEAVDILSSLFNSSGVKIWKEDRIAETTLAKPAELIPLDPKWIRRNNPRVFSVVEPIIIKSFLNLADPESSSLKLWRSLVGAVAAAATKEVKVSIDTAAFLGSALSLLMKLWAGGLEEATASADTQRSFLKATEVFLTSMILAIGHLPFTEKLLSMNEQNTLIPVATPSRRAGKGHGPTRSALHHLFSILSLLPPGISDGADLSDLFRAVFDPFMLSRSDRGRRDLAHELMQISHSDDPASYGVWIYIAEALVIYGENSQSSHLSTDSSNQPPIGHTFRDMVKHLEKGINNTPNLRWSDWLSFFDSVIGQATELSGEAGCSVAIIEPLAKTILESLAPVTNATIPNIYKCSVQLICNARQPRDRQALDAAKRRLWGTTVAGARSASLDPFDNLYRLIAHLLGASYKAEESVDEATIELLITETTHFLSRSNPVLAFKSLVELQQGIGSWVQDTDERCSSEERLTINRAVSSLWDRICSLCSEVTLEQFRLDAIEQLLCCAFTSKHRRIVSSAAVMWNERFENITEIQYPSSLRDVLISIQPYVDVTLPGLEIPAHTTNNSRHLFVDSQNDLATTTPGTPGQETDSGVKTRSSPRFLQTPGSRRSLRSGPDKSEDVQIRSRSVSRSGRSTKSADSKRTSKPRHEDSQILFAAVEECLPPIRAMESQVLTDRQQEVRQRQLENAVIYRSIQPNAENDEGGSVPDSRETYLHQAGRIQSPTADRSVTPRANRSFEYISSTPTPRRGQHLMVDEDHEMADDIPSSPPEPRRNLLPEMRSHSRDTRMLDHMPISSSPISGSPISKVLSRHEGEQSESREYTSSIIVKAMSGQQIGPTVFAPSTAEPCDSTTDYGQQPAEDECIDKHTTRDEIIAALGSSGTKSAPNLVIDGSLDETTSRVTQKHLSPIPTPAVESPNEDNLQCKDRSFEMSEGEERGLARLVIELDSRKCDPLPEYDDSSPEKAHKGKGPAMECITVRTGPQTGEKLPDQYQSNQSPPINTPSHSEISDSQATENGSKKRKRGASKGQRLHGKKRRRGMKAEDALTPVVDDLAPPASDEQPHPVLDTQLDEAQETVDRSQHHDEIPFVSSYGSPDLSYDADNPYPMEPLDLSDDSLDSDTAAVNRQLITEASQQSQADDHSQFADDNAVHHISSDLDVAMDSDNKAQQVAIPEPERKEITEENVMEKITNSLKNGLEGLRTATLSREDVYKIEDMFMDIKKELYEAERRSRRQ